MISLEAFDYIKYVFVFCILALALLFIVVTFFKKQFILVNWFTILSISLICIVVTLLNLIMVGYAADEINLDGTPFTIMFLIIVILSILNFIISYKNRLN